MTAAHHVTAFAPGRVNLIGEHTDYNEGVALPFAISEGVTAKAQARVGARIEAVATDLGEQDSFDLDDARPSQGWRAFVRGTVQELRRAGIPLRGARIEISGTVPRGAGLASSAALEVALASALIALHDARVPDPLDLVQLCARVENEWVGARTGLLDQIACVCCEPGSALRIDFRALTWRTVPLRLEGARLVLLDSGGRHAHAGSGYNQRRDECVRACALLGLASLRSATLDDASALPEPLARRARHVVEENARVEAAVAALESADLTALGRLLDASHDSLRDLYEVSTPAVEATVARLHDVGAIGARLIGGGFGGYVLGLLPLDARLPDGAREVRPGPGALLM